MFGLPKAKCSYRMPLLPTPRMDEFIISFIDALIFSDLDSTHGSLQVKTEDCDHKQTAFSLHHGFNRLSCLSFALRDAPETFQPPIYVNLSLVTISIRLGLFGRNYHSSQTLEENIRHVPTILVVLPRPGVMLSFEKCKPFTERTDNLGHVIQFSRLELALYHIHNTLRKATSYRNGTELDFGSMPCILTLGSQMCTDRCLT